MTDVSLELLSRYVKAAMFAIKRNKALNTSHPAVYVRNHRLHCQHTDALTSNVTHIHHLPAATLLYLTVTPTSQPHPQWHMHTCMHAKVISLSHTHLEQN